jgi:hypothetical protein
MAESRSDECTREQDDALRSPLVAMPTLVTSTGQQRVSKIHLGATPVAHQCAAVDTLPCRPAPCRPAPCQVRVRLHDVHDVEFIIHSEAAARRLWGDRIATVRDVTELRSPGASEDAQNCCSLHRRAPAFFQSMFSLGLPPLALMACGARRGSTHAVAVSLPHCQVLT